jgi:DNA gyrase subunit B
LRSLPSIRYKVARGKKELYLKDQVALDDLLLTLGTRDVSLTTEAGSESSRVLESEHLKALCEKVLAYQALLDKIDKRRDARLLDAMLQATSLGKADLSREELAEPTTAIERYMSQHHAEALPLDVTIEMDQEHEVNRWRMFTHKAGVRRESVFDTGFFDSGDYAELKRLTDQFKDVGNPPYTLVHKDGEPEEYERLEDVVNRIQEHARQGLTLQRYKGLGEMNPDQLWETTMNPENRTLLGVRVDDAVAADGIFTVLMGDQVEPRRDFIERFALEVRNLDV